MKLWPYHGEIRASTTRTGFIKGSNSAACFMDVPLQSLKYVLNESATDPARPRYEPYGIVVTKAYAYSKGCRPVLYLSNEELAAIGVPNEELWRVVRLEGVDGAGINWLHEREWRLKGDYKLPKKFMAALVQTNDAALRLRTAMARDPDVYKAVPGSIISLEVLCQGLPYLAAK